MIVVSVGPAKPVAFIYLVHGLRREFGALLDCIIVRPERVQLVASVLHNIECIGSGVPVETYDITQPCGVSGICTKFLPCLSSGEAPDAAVFLQYRAGFYSRRAGRTFFYLTCVGRGAHSHIEVAIVVEGE